MKIVSADTVDPAALIAFLDASGAAVQQYPAWADLQASRGSEAIHLVALDDLGKICVSVQAFVQQLPLGLRQVHVPRGPSVSKSLKCTVQNEFTQRLLAELEHEARKRRAVSLLVDWPGGMTDDANGRYSLQPAGETHYPSTTLVLDLAQSEDELLAQMKPKGRYNIRVAEKHGVTVEESHFAPLLRDGLRPPQDDSGASREKDADIFFHLLTKTTARDGFAGHPREYYRDFLAQLGEAASCFIAKNAEGTPVAASLVTWAGDTATYYYGASDHAHRALMAPYAVQWAAIRAAKERGYTTYDFLGIAPEGSAEHALAGVTSFKKKFGGRVVSYTPSGQRVLRPVAYAFLALARRLRALARR